MRLATFAAVVGLTMCAISPAAGEPSQSGTHTVTIEGMRFHPERLTVARGDAVVWINKDLVPHSATSESGQFDSEAIQTDKSWKFIARQEGEFAYICTFHPTMTAVLLVQ